MINSHNKVEVLTGAVKTSQMELVLKVDLVKWQCFAEDVLMVLMDLCPL